MVNKMLEKLSAWVSLMGSDEFFGIILMFIFLFFIIAFWRAQKEEKLDWTDIIKAKGTNSVSLTKLLNFIGGIVGTWIVIKLTLTGKITWEIFGLYLLYVGSIEAYSKYTAGRFNNNINQNYNSKYYYDDNDFNEISLNGGKKAILEEDDYDLKYLKNFSRKKIR
jgi:hypothetical protein